MAMQNRQQHRQSLRIKTHRQPARIAVCGIDQGLNLDQQGAGAFLRDHDARTGHHLAVLGEKEGGRVVHALQSAFGHGEDAKLVDRAIAIDRERRQLEKELEGIEEQIIAWAQEQTRAASEIYGVQLNLEATARDVETQRAGVLEALGFAFMGACR